MNTEITVSIPQFHAIQASTIEQYLNEKCPEWREIWHRFCTKQEGKQEIDGDSKKILEELQTTIKNSFANSSVAKIYLESEQELKLEDISFQEELGLEEILNTSKLLHYYDNIMVRSTSN
jgi:hypothetical protein